MHLSLEDLETRRESVDLEAKAAQGREGRGELPRSFWQSYSAMANTEGGEILLGVGEDRAGGLRVLGIAQPEPVVKALWNNLNNPKQVSANLLRDQDISIAEVDGHAVIVVRVPRARRTERPVYVGSNPLTGTYRRNYDGDYRCPEDVVRQLIADAGEESRDAQLLEGFGVADLDAESLAAYRHLFRATRPGHPWLELDDRGLLTCLGGYRRDRRAGAESLTAAGVLMFGRLPVILEAFPNYLVDYREEDPGRPERYLDRLTTDGTWAGNLFGFYRRVYPKLSAELKVPFAYRHGTTSRLDDTPIHEALREALVNALIHADQAGRTGIVIVKEPHRFTFRNPGGLRLSLDVVLHGGVTDCRNRHLQKMFQLIGEGEQVGSGLPRILAAWREQHWRVPLLREEYQPDRTELVLTMESLLPEPALAELHQRFGQRFLELDRDRRLAVATALIEGRVSNQRLRELVDLHPTDATLLFQDLVGRKMLAPRGARRSKYYVIPGDGGADGGDSAPGRGGDTKSAPRGTKLAPSRGTRSAPSRGTKSAPSRGTKSAPSRGTKSATGGGAGMAVSRHQARLLEFASESRSLREMMELLGFQDRTKFRTRFVRPLLAAGWLAMTIPEKPTSSRQRYLTTAAGSVALAAADPDAQRSGSV